MQKGQRSKQKSNKAVSSGHINEVCFVFPRGNKKPIKSSRQERHNQIYTFKRPQ